MPSLVMSEDTEEKLDPAALEFFEKKIRPVLVESCYECHSVDSRPIQGNLLLDNKAGTMKGGDSGPAIVIGKPDESLLVMALKYEGFEMPPKGKLPDEVIKDFEHWIRTGAVDPRKGEALATKPTIDFEKAKDFWAFKKPLKHEVPKVESDWIQMDIDKFVLSKLQSNDMTPSIPADRPTLIRRAYFDLIGLPPTPEQVEAFVNDPDERAFEKVVLELLSSKHYGERWGRRWLDVARYGEDQAHTFKARNYPRGYFYRDWVVNAFNDDMPYDDFIKHQIAGDLLETPDQHERIASLGLFALGPVYYAENVEKLKAQADEWDDRIDTLTRGVLGLTVSCARCHDHKYDPITMQDYYGLAGIFASTKYEERPIVSSDVVASRRSAEQRVKDQDLEINSFLISESRELRPLLANEISSYIQAGWHWLNRKRSEKDEKKLTKEVTDKFALSITLVKRWANLLTNRNARVLKQRPFLQDLFTYIDSLPKDKDHSADSAITEKITGLANQLQVAVQNLLGQKDELFSHFGDNLAFVRDSDRAQVEPGIIPLGNLFDDSNAVALDTALGSDKFKAIADSNKLGIDRTAFGWGTTTNIADGISFNFEHIGADARKHGQITNDAWDNAGGGISTEGQAYAANGPRKEQGIGMHANALLTFDLAEIRRAGLLPEDQQFTFKVDRAGVNDDAFGSNASGFIAVVISKPHKQKEVMDAILAGYVNGKKMEIDYSDFTYYFSGGIPDEMTANGEFVSYDITVPAEARYVTLIATGGYGPDDNSISSDHFVFSGARLEMKPIPDEAVVDAGDDKSRDFTEADKVNATLLSLMFYDEGLLAIPPSEAESKLPEEPKAQLAELRKQREEMQKQVDAISVPLAHSINEDGSRDVKIYLKGNPANQADAAPRAMPAIFTNGEKAPFESAGSGRLELANSVASADNPLTARVIVNRVWAGHFDKGLVSTLSNFGQLGNRPTHPELLDFLTVSFMESGWSIKSLHKQIMLSSVYQQSSKFNQAFHDVDPENKLLWRMNRRRLEVEPWRDSLLAVSGELETTLGGPAGNLDSAGNKRRTIYGFVSRHRLNELLRLFDFPDPNITSDARPVTTVPLQQLFVMNSDFMTQRAKAFSQRIQDHTQDEQSRIEFAYRTAFGRVPDDDELSAGLEFIQLPMIEGDKLTSWEQYALVMLGSNEFMFVD